MKKQPADNIRESGPGKHKHRFRRSGKNCGYNEKADVNCRCAILIPGTKLQSIVVCYTPLHTVSFTGNICVGCKCAELSN